MIYLDLFFVFFKIGLFALGGGLATIPFLADLATERTWFSLEDLVKMIAISESTPGPLGVNMATFAGTQTAGIGGGIIATLGLITPMFFSILLLCHFLKRFKHNHILETIFEGMRPAVAAMILCFVLLLLKMDFLTAYHSGQLYLSIFLFVNYTILTYHFKGHPILFILLGAVLGVICGL